MDREQNTKTDSKAERILTAARKILAQYGFAGATIARVAEEAGVSRGLLHYYFKNKEEMLANVLRANMESSAALVKQIFRHSRSVDELAGNITQVLRDLSASNPEYFDLFIEGVATTRQSPVVEEAVGALYHGFRNMLREELETWIERGVIEPSMPVGGLSALLTGLLDGMGLQLINIPGIAQDEEVWESFEKGLAGLIKM